MIKIEKSLCHGGKCSARFEVEWDVDYISSYERRMGEESEYTGDGEFECPNCGNVIRGTLSIYEYPVGCLNYEKIDDVSDTENTELSRFEEPLVAFYDI